MGVEDFVKLSVRYRADMQLAGVSPAAELAFVRGLAYCGLNGTGGLIPSGELANLGPRRVADELVAGGFWDVMPNGWAFRSWDKWQGDLEQVQAKRQRDADRMREYRRRKRREDMEATDGAA